MITKFVDWEYVRTDGVSGNVLLDVNDGIYYSMMLDSFKPRPAPLRKDFNDSPLRDGLAYSPGTSKDENIEIPMVIKCHKQEYQDALVEEIRRDEIFLLYQEREDTVKKYFPCSPAPEIDTDTYWSKAHQYHDLAIIAFTLSADDCYGEEEELTLDEDNFVGGSWEGVLGIIVPPSELLGNRPAPCDIYISVPYDSPPSRGFSNLLLGQRRVYHPDWDPVQEPTVGVNTPDTYRRGGDYRVVPGLVNLVQNPSFEDYSGDPEVWDDWTVERSGHTYTDVYASGEGHSGDHALVAGAHEPVPKGVYEFAWTDLISVDPDDAYLVSWWLKRYGASGHQLQCTTSVNFYDAGDNLVFGGTFLPHWVNIGVPPVWTEYLGWIYPENFPPGTTQIKLNFAFAKVPMPNWGWLFLDDVMLAATSGGAVIQAQFPINSHQGVFLPSIAMSFGDTTPNATVTFQSMLQTSDGSPISPSISPQTMDLGDPDTQFRELALMEDRAKALTIPSHVIGENVDRSQIEQVVRLNTSDANEEDVWYDAISLIPVDRSFVEVKGWQSEYMILDSHTGMVLTSLDGTLEKAQVYNPSLKTGTPRFEADPSGMNMTLMAIYDDDNDHQMTDELEIVLRYRPRYRY